MSDEAGSARSLMIESFMTFTGKWRRIARISTNSALAADLVRFLANHSGLQPSLHHCEGDMLQDFVRMARAPVLLSAASSMSCAPFLCVGKLQ